MSSSDKAQVQTDIKLEDGVTIVQENVTDIQNYLDTFNKEIQGGDQVVQQVGVVAADDGGAEEGTYYVDQAGQYYYQSPACDGQQVMTVVSGIPGASGEGGESFVALPASAASAQRDNGGSNTTPLLIQTAAATTSGGSGGSTVATTAASAATDGAGAGGATYQTVTIVPSETNPGELSYLLIVQQPGDDEEGADGEPKDKDDDDDHDLTVYDFDDAEDVGAVSGMESGEEDDKSKIVKFVPKKSQTVTQAHMCNYCNYTSPKRYLLSRHMKSHSEERPHKCSVCERGFKTLASLQNHVNTHTGTKPHRCKHCDSAFTTSGELVRHVRYKHTHEKPHKCTICDYASVELSKMRNHMRCHTGERPYQVGAAQAQLSGCSARSKRSLAWDYFTEVDDRSAMCLLCSRVIRHYNGTRNLLVHVRRVHVAATSKQAKQDDSDGDKEIRLDTTGHSVPQNSDQLDISGRGVEISNPVSSVVELGAQNREISGQGVEISNPEMSVIVDYQTNPELEIISESGIDILGPSLSSIVDYDAETNAGFDVEISGQPLSSVIEFGSTQLEDGSGVEISDHSVSPVIDYGVEARCELEIQSASLALDYDTTELQTKASVSSVIDYDVQTDVNFEMSACGVVISDPTTYEVQTAESENRSSVVISPSNVDFGTKTNAGLETVSTMIISSNTDNPVLHYTNQDKVELETVSNVVITSQAVSGIVDNQVSTNQEVQGVLKETIFPSAESTVVDYQSTGVEANSGVQFVSNATISPSRSIAVIGGEATSSEVQPVSNKSDAELLVSDYEAQTAPEMNTVSKVLVASHPVTNAIDYKVVNSELGTSSSVVISSSSGIDYEVTNAELKTTDASLPPKPVVVSDSPKPSTSDLAEEFPLQKLQIILLFFEKINVTNAICTVCRKSVAHKGYLKPVLHHLLRSHRRAVSDAMLDQASCVAKLNSVYENLQEAVTIVLTVFEKDAELWSCDTKFRVWKYFYRTNKLVAMCLLCFCDFKVSKTVDNLVNHLKRNHPTVSVEDLEDNSSLQGGNKRKCKVVSDEMGNVWAYFVKKNDRIALCTLCPTNLYFLNNNNILSNHLTVKHGIVFDKRLSSNEETGSELLGNSENNDKKQSKSPNKVLVGRKFLETSSKVVVCRKVLKYPDKALVRKRLLETSKKAIVGRKFLQSSNKNVDERKLAKTTDIVCVESKLMENSTEVLVERSLKSSPKAIVGKSSVESSSEGEVEKRVVPVSSSEVEVVKRVPVSSPEFEGKLPVSSLEVIVEKRFPIGSSPEVIVENYDSRKSLKMSPTSTTKRHSIVWQHFKEVSTRLAQCHLCKKNVESFGSTGALLRHLRKFHVDVLGENASNPQKTNKKSQRSFVWEYFTRESQKSSICNLCKWVVRGENTGNLIHHLKRRHEHDLVGKPIGLWLMSTGGGREKEKKKTDKKKKKGGKKPSIVWSYFIEKDDVTASCLLCKRDIKHYKTTKNLLEHLRRIHPQTLKLNKDGGDDDYVTAGSEVGEELPFIETVTDADFQPTSTEVPPPNSSRKVVSEPRGSGDKSSTFISKHFIKFQDNIYLCKSCQNTIENVKSLRKLSDHLRSAHKGMLDEGCVAAAIDNLDDVSNSTCASSAVLNSELNTILETLEKSGDKSEEPMSGFGDEKKDQHQSIVLKSFSRKDETTVTCLFCGEDIERFCGINNLLDHLESKHPDYQLVDSLTIPFAITTSDSQLVDNGLLKNLNTFACGAEESDHQLVLSKEDDMFLNKNLNSFNDGNNQQLSLSKSDELFVEKNLNSFNFSTEASDQQLVLNKDDEMFVEKNFNSLNCNSETTDQNFCINDESFMGKGTSYIVATDSVLSGKQLVINEQRMVLIEKSDGTFDTSGKQVGLHENAEIFIDNDPNSFGKNYVVSCGKKVINENSELFMGTSNNDTLSGNNVVFSGKQLGVNKKGEIFSEKSDNTFNTSDVAISGTQLSINEKDEVFFERSSSSFNTSDGVFSGKRLDVGKNHEMFVETSTYPFETNHIVTASKQLEFNGNNVEESNQFDKNDVVISGKQLRIDENGDLFVDKPTDSFVTSGIMGVEKLDFNESNRETGIDQQTNSFNTNDSSSRGFVIDENSGILVGKLANSFETNNLIITEQQLEFNENNVGYLENESNSFNKTDTAIANVMNENDMIVSGKRLLINESGGIFVEEQTNPNTDVSVATYTINDVIVRNEQFQLNEGGTMFIEKETNSFNTGGTAFNNSLGSNDNRQIVFNADGETFAVKETHSLMTDHLNEGREMGVENEANNTSVPGQTLDMNEMDQTGFVRKQNTCNFNTGDVDNVEACKYLVSNSLCGVEQVTNLVENQLNNFNQNSVNVTAGEPSLVENQLNFNENLVNASDNERENQLNFNEDNGGNSELPNMDMVVDSINHMDLEGIADDFLNNVVPGHIEMSVIGDENRVDNSSLVNGSDVAAASLTFEYQTKDDIRSLCSLICNCDVWSGNSGDIVSHMRATHGVILKHSPKEQVQKMAEEEANVKKKKKVKKKNDGKTEKKKGYKKRSVIWRYFVEKDEKTATCLRCGLDFSRSYSRNLLTHLRRKHAIGCEENSSASNICRNSKVVSERSAKRERNVKKSSVVWKYFKETKGSSDSCGYVCVLCNEESDCKTFSTVLSMRNHLRQVHGIVFKKRPKRFSYVWKYFRVDEEGGDDQNCTCTLCGKELKNYSDVRVLKNHLKNSHADVFSCAREVDEEDSGLNVDVVVPDKGVSEAGLKAVAVIEDCNIEDVVQPMFDVDYKCHKRKRSKVWSYFTDANDTTCVCKLCSVQIKHAKATPNLIEHMRRIHPGVLSEDMLQKRSKEAPKKSVVWKHFRKDDENSKAAHVVCKLCDVKIKHNRTTKKLVSHIRKLHHEVYLKDLVKSRQSQTVAPPIGEEDLNNGELLNTSKKRKGANKKKSSTTTRRKNLMDEASQTTVPYTEGENLKNEQPHTTKTHRRKNAKSSKVKESTIVKSIASVSKNNSVRNFLNSSRLEVVNVTVAGNSNLRKPHVSIIDSENVVTGDSSKIQKKMFGNDIEVELAENHGFDPQLLQFPLKRACVRLERYVTD